MTARWIPLLQRGILIAGGSLSAGVPVLAQTTLEEVVVTATRRESTIQDLGLSVTAFSGEQLRELNNVRFDDIALQTPGLQFTQAGGAPLLGLISIRGVAQNDFAAHLEAASALYVDDAYRPSNAASIQNLYDIDRVEVIKGPQGTLFGRNATGGLIHIVTRDPVIGEFGGFAEIGYAEFNDLSAQAAINLPISDIAAARIAVNYREHDGWIENDIGPDSVADDTRAIRGKLLVQPNNGWRVKLTADYYEVNDIDAGGGFPTGGFVGPDTLGRFRPSGRNDAGYVDADGDVFTGSFDFPGKYDRSEYNLVGDVEYSWDNYTVTWISAYSDIDVAYSEDNDLSPFDLTIFRQNTVQDSWSQELRLNAEWERLRLTTGFYYLDIDGEYFQNFQINNLGNFNNILAPIPVPILPVGLNQFADYSLQTSSWSLFAQGEYDLTDRLTMTLGIRYTEDEKDYAYRNVCQNLLPPPIPPACPPGGFPPNTLAGAGLVTDSHTEDGISARVQLDFALSDDTLLYASYNRGYKAFSYNAGFAGAALVSDVRFDGEFLDAFEVGAKLDFWGSRARLNVAGFYYDYHDYQAFDQRGVNFILTNTDATVYGGDAELTLSPGWGVNVNLGLALVDTEVKDIPIGGQSLDREAPQAPDISFNFAVSKTIDIAYGSLRIGADGTYTDEYFSQLTNAPVTLVQDNWLVNLRASWTSPDAHWEATVFARNVFDEERQTYAFDITFPGNGLVEQNYAPPRWVGGSVRYNF